MPTSTYNYSPVGGQWAEYTPQEGIKLDQKNVLGNPQQALEILKHEMAHAMDRNVNAQYQESADKPANSLDFFKTFQNADPNEVLRLARWLMETGYPQNNLNVSDIEGFAQYGSGGQNSLLSHPDIAKFYKDIYLPMNKNINYSPVFPSREYQERFLKK